MPQNARRHGLRGVDGVNRPFQLLAGRRPATPTGRSGRQHRQWIDTEVAAALRTGEVDVALVHTYDFVATLPEPGLDTVHVFDEPMFLAAPRTLAPLPDDEPLRRWREAPWIIPPLPPDPGS